jgi:hypothetical protein
MKRIKKYIVLLLTIAIYLSGMAVTAFAATVAADDGTQVVTHEDSSKVIAQQVADRSRRITLRRRQSWSADRAREP